MRPRCLTVAVCLALLQNSTPSDSQESTDDPRGEATSGDVATLRVAGMVCTVGNNKSLRTPAGPHRAGYNGVFALQTPDLTESSFVTAYSGWNLEHFFDARRRSSDPAVFFEPRYAAMRMTQRTERSVVLHQPPTPTTGVESWTEFEVAEPYYLNFSFRCTPHRDVFKGGFFGVFWASYINSPSDKSIYFLAAGSTLDKPLWLQFCTQEHDRDSTVRSAKDMTNLSFDAPDSSLFSSMSALRYSEPFFYGRFRDRVLIYIFEPNSNLRFAHSPTGGGLNSRGDDTNPAWDFQLIVPDYQIGKEYGLRGRLVYKKWQGRADVIEEVREYRKRK